MLFAGTLCCLCFAAMYGSSQHHPLCVRFCTIEFITINDEKSRFAEIDETINEALKKNWTPDEVLKKSKHQPTFNSDREKDGIRPLSTLQLVPIDQDNQIPDLTTAKCVIYWVEWQTSQKPPKILIYGLHWNKAGEITKLAGHLYK